MTTEHEEAWADAFAKFSLATEPQHATLRIDDGIREKWKTKQQTAKRGTEY